MDQHFQIGIALDRIRETQWHQNALLDAIARNQIRNQELLTELLNTRNGAVYTGHQEQKMSSGFLKMLASSGVKTGAQWLGGSLGIAYVIKGGDIGQLLEAVLKVWAGG